jgi:hypothetical protein
MIDVHIDDDSFSDDFCGYSASDEYSSSDDDSSSEDIADEDLLQDGQSLGQKVRFTYNLLTFLSLR